MKLDDLLVAAGEAPPESRIEFRDPIAAFGVEAIARLEGDAWLFDPRYAGFAIQTIKRAGQLGALSEAIQALQNAAPAMDVEAHRRDIEAALHQLGVARPERRALPTRLARGTAVAPISPEELIVGRLYRRSDLHDRGLGGNRQRGISYPADGTYCLLFSDPSKASELGYRDGPVGDDGYRYFGAWDGAGDMPMTRGNQVVLDRTPELFLFVKSRSTHQYVGQFECTGHRTERTVRDGAERNAIVFDLRRRRR